MSNIEILVNGVKDPVARDNFDELRQYINTFVFNNFDGKHFDIEFAGAVSNFRYKHYLGFLPKDVLETSRIGAGTLTWNYDKFDKEYLDITTTGPVRVRAFIGTHAEI